MTDFELHLVGHSAGAMILAIAQRSGGAGAAGASRSMHLFAPACSVQFANRHYPPHAELMQQLYLHTCRTGSNATTPWPRFIASRCCICVQCTGDRLAHTDPGAGECFQAGLPGLERTSSTGDTLRAWQQAAAPADCSSRAHDGWSTPAGAHGLPDRLYKPPMAVSTTTSTR